LRSWLVYKIQNLNPARRLLSSDRVDAILFNCFEFEKVPSSGASNGPLKTSKLQQLRASVMPEHLQLSHPPSHAQTLREGAGRRLSRSPHPYHRQQSELPYASERFIANTRSLRPTSNTDHEDQENRRPLSQGYKEVMDSESGTEADDEHFLKGLPAPKLRPHKGLRGTDGSLSSSPSPLMSPAIFGEDQRRISGILRNTSAAIAALDEEDARKLAAKIQKKRVAEIVRRSTEAGILLFVGGLLCLNSGVRELLWIWKRGEYYFKICLFNETNCYRTLVPGLGSFSTPFALPSSSTTTHKSHKSIQETSSNRNSSGLRPCSPILSSRYIYARLYLSVCEQTGWFAPNYYSGYSLSSKGLVTFFRGTRRLKHCALVHLHSPTNDLGTNESQKFLLRSRNSCIISTPAPSHLCYLALLDNYQSSASRATAALCRTD